MSVTFAQVEREALTLPAEERARLADKLWESLAGRDGLQVVMTPALERLLDEGLEHMNQAKSTEDIGRQK
jgi:Putative addiction module component